MKALRADIKEIKDGTATRLAALEEHKLDKQEADRLYQEHLKKHDDFETRLRFIEKYMWAAIGILGVVQIAIQFFYGG